MFTLFFILCFSFGHFSFAKENVSPIPQSKTVSLAETLNQTLATNPQIKEAQAEYNSALAQVTQAWSSFKPDASISYEVGKTDSVTNRNRNDFDIDNASATIDQPLFSGLGDYYSLRAAKAFARSEKAQFEQTKQQILFEAATAHFRLIQANKNFTYAQAREELLKAQQDISRSRKKHGVISQTDVAQSMSQLADAMAGTIAAESSLLEAKLEFQRVVGFSAERMPKALSEKDLPTVSINKEELQKNLFMQSPDYMRAHELMKQAEFQLKSERGSYLPKIFARGRYNIDKFAGSDGSLNTESTSISLNLSFDIYDGGNKYGRISEAKYNWIRAKHFFDRIKRNSLRSLLRAFHRSSLFAKTITARKIGVEQAQIALDGYRSEYSAGTRSTSDLLVVERALFDAKLAYEQAIADHLIAIYELKSLLNQISVGSLKNPTLDPNGALTAQ